MNVIIDKRVLRKFWQDVEKEIDIMNKELSVQCFDYNTWISLIVTTLGNAFYGSEEKKERVIYPAMVAIAACAAFLALEAKQFITQVEDYAELENKILKGLNYKKIGTGEAFIGRGKWLDLYKMVLIDRVHENGKCYPKEFLVGARCKNQDDAVRVVNKFLRNKIQKKFPTYTFLVLFAYAEKREDAIGGDIFCKLVWAWDNIVVHDDEVANGWVVLVKCAVVEKLSKEVLDDK